MNHQKRLLAFAISLLVTASTAIAQTPVSTSFTYQGRLNLAGAPVNDSADLQFTLYDAEIDGNAVGSSLAVDNVMVVDGLFTVELDFGVLAFNGDARWLEIAVRSPHDPSDMEAFTTLDPRQPVTATPYALQTRGISVDDQGTVAANAFVGDGSGLTNLPTQNGLWEISGSDIHYSAGNVGIGEPNPTAPLHFANDVGDKISFWQNDPNAFYGMGIQGGVLQLFTAAPTTSVVFGHGSSDSFTEVMRVQGDGNVGIGTDTPASELDVNGTVTATAFFGERIGRGLENIRFDNGILLGVADLFIDQQLEFDGGGVGPSTDAWQSFTAGVTGELGAVDLLRYSVGAAGTVTIYEGEGTGAAILGGGSMPEQPVHGWQEVVLSSPIPLTSGQMYTIRVRSGTNNWVDNGGGFSGPTYSGGRSSSDPYVDYYFRTKMLQGSDTMIVHNGRVGIGSAAPASELDVAGTVTATAFVGDGSALTNLPAPEGLWNVNGNDLYYGTGNVGIGTDTPTNQLSVAGNADFSGNVGIGTDMPTNQLTVAGDADFNGRVGIGTDNPTRGLVDIEGFVSRALGLSGFLAPPGITGPDLGTAPANYSLYASHRIAASMFNAHSDARIKNVAGLSNHDADLETLMAIEVTDYTMVDTVTNGADAYKKVIGQQVREAYPQAVTLSTDVVPDIYQSASVEDGWILLATNLEAGDRVKLITEDRARVHDVLEVHADRFRVEHSPSGRVFVYGREIDDFHNVDYEAIAMLNVSATQALHWRIAEQDVEIAELKERLIRLESLLTERTRR